MDRLKFFITGAVLFLACSGIIYWIGNHKGREADSMKLNHF